MFYFSSFWCDPPLGTALWHDYIHSGGEKKQGKFEDKDAKTDADTAILAGILIYPTREFDVVLYPVVCFTTV